MAVAAAAVDVVDAVRDHHTRTVMHAGAVAAFRRHRVDC